MNAPDRAAWLAQRRTGIGGSDIAAILGLSPYKTQVELWLDKTGRQIEADSSPEQAERMHWGNMLEDIVAREYAARRVVRIQRINTMLRHPVYKAAIANLDRAVVADGSRARWDESAGQVRGATSVLEVKTAHALAAQSPDWGEAGSDEVPVHYWTQVQWYLAVSGLPYGELAVLFGGQQMRIYRIEAHATTHQDMLERAQDWWHRHVEGDIPPDPATEEDARALWKQAKPGAEVIVSPEVAQAVEELKAIKAQIGNDKTEGTLEYRIKQLRDVICSSFGEAEAIAFGGQRLATWKFNRDSEKTDWKAVATALVPPPELIALHTTTTKGARVLRVG